MTTRRKKKRSSRSHRCRVPVSVPAVVAQRTAVAAVAPGGPAMTHLQRANSATPPYLPLYESFRSSDAVKISINMMYG